VSQIVETAPTTTVEAPSAPSRFRPDIEALRAIAVVAVVAYHAGVPGFDGGFVGVDVFFVISGFLITGQMLRDADGPGFRFAEFYARRARRLLPAATLAIIGTLVGSALFLSPLVHASIGADARSASLFFSNMRFASEATDYFAAARNPSPFQQFWSLSVEEQFYLVWPALVALALIGTVVSARAHRRRLAVVLGVLVAVSFVACVWLTSYSQPWAFFWLGPRAWELGIGALLAVGAGRIARLRPGHRAAAAATGLVLVLGSVVLISSEDAWPGYLAALPVLGTALLVAAGTGGRAPVLGRVFALAPFQWGGRYSYSLYLWHWPVLVIAAHVFATVASSWIRASAFVVVVAVPAAVLSFHLVEKPVRHAPALQTPRAALSMGALLVAGSVAATLLYGAVTVGSDLDAGRPAAVRGADIGTGLPITEYVPTGMNPALADLVDATPTPPPPGCSTIEGGDATVTCVLGPGTATPSLYIFGDSHAAHWTPVLERYAAERGIRIRRLAAGGCGSYLVTPVNESTRNCLAWRDEVFDLIEQEQPEVVLLSNHSIAAQNRDRDEWDRGVRETIRRISPSSRVVVLGVTPWSGTSIPECLAENLTATAECEPDADLYHRFSEDERRVSTEEGAGWIDTASWLCDDERCPVVVGDILVYRDKDHLTVPFIEARYDQLAAALDAELGR
jgi:peptidoglycan/LPS O-acetylase OafA/YrhL